MMVIWIILALVVGPTVASAAAAACNPLTTNGCAAIPGLASSSYSIDFTKTKSLPSDWILADASNITFGSDGIQFNFNKRKDAPYVWTNFYIAYGKIDVEMKVAAGTGVITSAVMFSDDADEIDWEFSGSNLGAGVGNGKAQTNVFGKGITGNYDRGTLQSVSPAPQTSFHVYTLNWTPDRIDWIIDGVTKYTTTNNHQKTGNYQFPQTPSRLHLGLWDAGDPDTAAGTRNWAGGLTDYAKVPYIAYVRTVKITTPFPCKAWQYPNDFSGSWTDVQCSNATLPNSASASATTTSVSPKSTEAVYTVVAGDNGYIIASKLGCTFDQLSAVNPGVKWDFLDIGQKLNNPNAAKMNITSTSVISSVLNSTKSPGPSTPTTSGASGALTSVKSNSSILTTSAPGISMSRSALTSASARGSPTTSTVAVSGTPISMSTSMSVSAKTSPATTYTTPSPTQNYTVSSTVLSCTSDKCVNSMTASQFLSSAMSFCSMYNKTTTLAIPTFLSGCGTVVSQVQSACNCLYHNYTTVASANVSMTATSPTKSGSFTSSSFKSSAATKTTSSNAGCSKSHGHWGWNPWAGKTGHGRKRSENTDQHEVAGHLGLGGGWREHH